MSSLIGRLEERIQKVTEEIRAGRVFADGKKSLALMEILQRLKRILSLRATRDFLRDLWFGRPGTKDESYDVDEFGMDPSFIRRVKPLFDFLYYNYWRVTVEGLINVPAAGRGLIVANHSGTLPYDGSMIAASVVNEHPSRKDVRFLVEDFVYHFPFLGTFMYRIGGVRACPENAERLLAKEHLVTVFPEGIKGIGKNYKERYRLQRFGRGGFIKLALRMNAPILPTAVIGAEEIHPLLYKSTLLARPFGIPYIPVTPTLPLFGLLGVIPLPSKWTIVFGEPIRFSPKYGPKDAEDQLLVNRLSEMVRCRIQDMVTEALKRRRSIWFG
jgi:1-acyl-sn-glycerol-3-phosphate acyltransferase